MLNKYDFKYILRRVLTAIIISLILMFISSKKVNALSDGYVTGTNLRVNNTKIISQSYSWFDRGNKSIRIAFRREENYSTYFMFAMCISGKINGWYINSGLEEINFLNTTQWCSFPNSTYDGGRVLYVWGQMSESQCQQSGLNCTLVGNATFGTDDSISLVLLDFVIDEAPIEFDRSNPPDYSSYFNNINNSINNQNTIINNGFNQQHQDSQNEQQKLEDINDSITSEEMPDTNNMAEWSSNNAENGVITNLLTLPIKLLNGYVNGINASCTSFNLGSLYGTNLILPCINVSNYIGSTLWGVIDVLFSGFMIFAIGKKLVRIFNDFTNLRDHQIDELYGGGA